MKNMYSTKNKQKSVLIVGKATQLTLGTGAWGSETHSRPWTPQGYTDKKHI